MALLYEWCGLEEPTGAKAARDARVAELEEELATLRGIFARDCLADSAALEYAHRMGAREELARCVALAREAAGVEELQGDVEAGGDVPLASHERAARALTDLAAKIGVVRDE